MTTVTWVEQHIGRRLAAARRMREMSEEALAQKLSLTPQQIKEYEQGDDVVGAAQLHDIARALEINVSFFYEGLNGAVTCPYSLSEERYGLLRRALQRIAADHEFTVGGCRKKLPLCMAVEIARDVCGTLGWSYASQSAAGTTVNSMVLPPVELTP